MKNIAHSPLFNVLMFSIFWASEIFVAKLAFNAGAEVVPFSLQSFSVTLILLALYVLPKRHKELTAIPFKTLKWLLLANGILLGLGGFLGNAGVQLTSAVNAGFLTQFGTVTTTIIAWIMLKEKITFAKTISIIVIMVGTFLLVTKGQLIVPYIGDLLILCACICWGLGAVMVKKTLSHTSINPDLVSFLRPAAGIPILLLFVLLSPLYHQSLQPVFNVNIFEMNQTPYVILNAVFLALVWIFANRTLKYATASYTVMMSSVTPILVALLALIFLKETIDRVQLIGILLIIASSFVTHFRKLDRHY